MERENIKIIHLLGGAMMAPTDACWCSFHIPSESQTWTCSVYRHIRISKQPTSSCKQPSSCRLSPNSLKRDENTCASWRRPRQHLATKGKSVLLTQKHSGEKMDACIGTFGSPDDDMLIWDKFSTAFVCVSEYDDDDQLENGPATTVQTQREEFDRTRRAKITAGRKKTAADALLFFFSQSLSRNQAEMKLKHTRR